MVDAPAGEHQAQDAAPAWGAVFATSLCVFVLIASEFMPVSLLSPIAHDLADDAEAGGGLMVAVVQLAITAGATLGGLVFDAGGPRIDVLSGDGVLMLAALVAFGGTGSILAGAARRVAPGESSHSDWSQP